MNDNTGIGFFVHTRTHNYSELRLYRNGEPSNYFYSRVLSKEELIELNKIITELLKQWK